MSRRLVQVARGVIVAMLMLLVLPQTVWAHDYEPVNPPYPDPHFLDPQVLVTPSDGLVTGQTVMVTGRFFGANDTNGVLRQCTVDLARCDTRTATFTTGSNGEFNPIDAPNTPEDPQTIPIPFTVNPRFTATTGAAVNCLVTACVLYARWADTAEVRAGAHHLAFRVPDGLRPADYNGDGKADFGIYRPSNGGWYVAFSGGGSTTASWGIAGDRPVPGDYNGDGRTDFGAYRPSTGAWYIAYAGGGSTTASWGVSGDVAVPGDYNGDGKTDFGVYRPTTGAWYVALAGGGSMTAAWGASGDVAVPGDYNGDGKTDFGVFRPANGTWYIAYSGGGSTSAVWGAAGDIPVPADYNADGRTDFAYYRPTTGAWRASLAGGGTITATWGVSGDVPVPGDYNGDGKADFAVYRPPNGGWYVAFSGGGSMSASWGTTGDIPLSMPYLIWRQFNP